MHTPGRTLRYTKYRFRSRQSKGNWPKETWKEMSHISASNYWYHKGMTLRLCVYLSTDILFLINTCFTACHLYVEFISTQLIGQDLITGHWSHGSDSTPSLLRPDFNLWPGTEILLQALQAEATWDQVYSGVCMQNLGRALIIISISLTNIWPLSFLLLYIFTFHFQWFLTRKLITKKLLTTNRLNTNEIQKQQHWDLTLCP